MGKGIIVAACILTILGGLTKAVPVKCITREGEIGQVEIVGSRTTQIFDPSVKCEDLEKYSSKLRGSQDVSTPKLYAGIMDTVPSRPLGCLDSTEISCMYCCKDAKCWGKSQCDKEWQKVNEWAFFQVFYTIGMQIILLTAFLIVSIVYKRNKNYLLSKLNAEKKPDLESIIEEDASRKNTYFIA